jgi:Tfp pilus assembly protein PilN
MVKIQKPVYKPTININILYPQGSFQKLPIRFLKWLVSYGRYMAVAVEIIVVATFVMRFKLDADLADLKTKISLQLPVIQSHAQDEADIRRFQFKLATISKTFAASPDWDTILNSISQELPSGVKLNNINMDDSAPATGLAIRMTGQADSSNDLGIFIAGLKQDKKIKQVVLASITLEQGQIQFSLTGTY